MKTETLTDRELDAWLAEHLLGLTAEMLPTRYSPEDGSTSPITFKHEEWKLPEAEVTPFVNVRRHPYDGAIEDTFVGGDPLLAYSSTGDGMLLMLEAMRGRGWDCDLETHREGYRVFFWPPSHVANDGVRVISTVSLPRAVAEAAKAALEAETTDQRIDNEAIFQHGKVPGFTGFTMET